jgi:hypothetical protein
MKIKNFNFKKRVMTFSLCMSMAGSILSGFGYAPKAAEPVDGLMVAEEENKETSGTKKFEDEMAYQVLDIVNQERANKGLAPLTMDVDLFEAAKVRGCEISYEFSHTRPDGSSCFTACEKMMGENIAAGYGSPESVMNGWMNSDGHRANILNSSYKSIGISCYNDNGYLYWVQVFGTCEATPISLEDTSEPTVGNEQGDLEDFPDDVELPEFGDEDADEEAVEEEPVDVPTEEPVEEDPADVPTEEPVEEDPVDVPTEEPVEEEPADVPTDEEPDSVPSTPVYPTFPGCNPETMNMLLERVRFIITFLQQNGIF